MFINPLPRALCAAVRTIDRSSQPLPGSLLYGATDPIAAPK
jgi:hypothetical protein